MGQLVFQATLGGAVNLIGPNISTTLNLTLPSADGSSGQALTTNGSGVLAFTSVTTAPGGSTTQVQYNNAGAFAGSANLTFNGTTLTAAGLSGPHNGSVGATTPSTGVFTTLTDSGLTSGRVTYATTAGLLTDSANLLYSGTDLTVYGLTVGRGAGAVSTNTAVGASALATNSTGNNATAIGYQAAYSNTSNNTTYIGSQAGYFQTGGTNTAVGQAAMYGVTGTSTGTFNVAVGNGSLIGNTSGGNNVALGAQSLYSNTTASNNTAIGYQAGYSNTTSSANTSVGYQAGYSTTTSFGDVNAFGWRALYSNTTGYSNTAMGSEALRQNTTANNNTAVGYQAAYSNTTGGITAFGYQAGYSNTTGLRCVYLGRGAGYGSTGDNNTFVGYGAGNVSTGVNNTFVGGYNSSFGAAGGDMTTGSKNTILGTYTGNQGGLDIRTSSNYIVLSDGDGNPRVRVDGSGYLYCPGTYALTTGSAANMFVGTDGSFQRSTSALKYKQDIRDLEELDISTLRPVRYKSKCERDDQTKDHFGVIADEAADAGFEELVSRGADSEIEGFQYERLTVVLLKKLQTLDADFKAYKASHP